MCERERASYVTDSDPQVICYHTPSSQDLQEEEGKKTQIMYLLWLDRFIIISLSFFRSLCLCVCVLLMQKLSWNTSANLYWLKHTWDALLQLQVMEKKLIIIIIIDILIMNMLK